MEAQEPRMGNGCLSAQHDLDKDATGETVHLVRQAVSEGGAPRRNAPPRGHTIKTQRME